MLHHRTRAHAPDDPIQLKQTLLGLVVCDHPGLWSLTELDHYLHPSSDTPAAAEPSRAATEDAVEDLYAAGLIHRIGHYVSPRRSPMAA
jgi:hypothetical protein